MKYILLGVILCIFGFAYLRAEQRKIWNDCLAALTVPDDSSGNSSSPAPSMPPPDDAPPVATPIPVTPSRQPSAVAEVISPTVPTTNSVVVAQREFVPPYPLPAQPNWTWSIQGKDYNNVVVTRAEADRVHISYTGGVGTLNTSDLTPEIQKQLNFDPEFAAKAAKERADDQAKIDAEEAPKIAAMNAQEARQAQADQAQTAQAGQAETARERISVAEDQRGNFQSDIEQMENAHEVSVSVDPKTGAETIGGSSFWKDKYYADEQAIGRCNQVINSGGK